MKLVSPDVILTRFLQGSLRALPSFSLGILLCELSRKLASADSLAIAAMPHDEDSLLLLASYAYRRVKLGLS